jgi:hypothetical protein
MVKLNKDKLEAGAAADTLDIVNAYYSVLEDRQKFGVAAPQSMLPFTRGDIKSALKAAAREAVEPEERARLKRGYISLADFVPDEAAERVNDNWTEVADAQCETERELAGASDTELMAEVVNIQKGIADEGARLAQEFDSFIAENS